MDCLKDMWDLQDTEIEMVKLRKEWDKVKELMANERRSDLEQIQAGIDTAREEWQQVKVDHDGTAAEIETINYKLQQSKQQLYEEGGLSKELLSLQQNISQLEKRKAALEETQLENIGQLELLEKKITDEICRFQRLDDQMRSRICRLLQRQEEINENYKFLKLKREQLRTSIPNYMMAIYNDLVAQKKRPLAILKDENCGGCGVAQTVLNVNALKKSGQYTRCSNCGRILILETTVNNKD